MAVQPDDLSHAVMIEGLKSFRDTMTSAKWQETDNVNMEGYDHRSYP